MINCIYQLVAPKVFSIKYSDINFENNVIIRPRYMSICHADQRYYLGMREPNILKSKLPMALIHECCGVVVCDNTGSFNVGQTVVLIPNVPGTNRNGIFENYSEGSKFLSSGYDGFMKEFVSITPDRVVPFGEINEKVASICEFVSVGVHGVKRFCECKNSYHDVITVWGDGSLSYVVCCILKRKFKSSKIVVVGRSWSKLSQFSFVDKTYICNDLPDNFRTDHAFECAGGNGSYYAIDDIIKYIRPQGTVVLMGVSENKVPINTRNVLEKGLTLIGCSRSGREDFVEAISLIKNKEVEKRLAAILFEDLPVCSISDIHRAFLTDYSMPFKTIFEWKI